MLNDNLARDLRDDPVSASETTENKTLREKEQNEGDCHYIYRRIHAELTRRSYKCKISGSYPFNITVSAPSRAYPSLAIMRHRSGRFIAGPVGGPVARGPNVSNDDLPIFRCHDREEVLDHVERYVILTSPRMRQVQMQAITDASEELQPSGASKLKWPIIAAIFLAIIVGARLMGAI